MIKALYLGGSAAALLFIVNAITPSSKDLSLQGVGDNSMATLKISGDTAELYLPAEGVRPEQRFKLTTNSRRTEFVDKQSKRAFHLAPTNGTGGPMNPYPGLATGDYASLDINELEPRFRGPLVLKEKP